MPDEPANEELILLTADIVGAHVSHNGVALDRVPAFIQTVYDALAGLGAPAAAPPAALEPAVSIRSSVKPDSITCIECGKKFKMLKRHLLADHGLSVEAYRERWDLRPDYPVVAPNYAQVRRDLAHKIGLGLKAGQKLGKRKAKV